MHRGQAAGALVMDAALAAIAVEHGATYSTDRDFSKFPDLDWRNPPTPWATAWRD